MKIIETNILDAMQIHDITILIKDCFAYDGLQNEAFLSNEINFNQNLACFYLGYEDSKLVAFLTTFMPQSHEAEIIAYTHPAYRRQGRFNQLYQTAVSVLLPAGITQVLFVVEPVSKTGEQVLQKKEGITFERSEYRMQHTDKTKIPSHSNLLLMNVSTMNQEECIKLTREIFDMSEEENQNFIQNAMDSKDRAIYLTYYKNEPMGTFNIHYEANHAFLYGLGIKPCMQGKGFGKQLLGLALETAYQKKKRVVLDVDSNNPPAYELYRKSGFVTSFQVDYYCLNLEQKYNNSH
ncbi:GNAT family N-acetyltransferase [Paludicola sp. MB14-C6]|uniref:GNAT family N-acetyltransferase n=1 Tax=Paludihabitans sp. MB14-C6 TaxID=3070656 RepID=UPI0027DAF693|nr:GNAT family N-acetyltransferase [Paludicola sp. MB14-C6]WMJ24144.1 GNAT family N-acetyltransferase [Paludicola sp. MB14-C6]